MLSPHPKLERGSRNVSLRVCDLLVLESYHQVTEFDLNVRLTHDFASDTAKPSGSFVTSDQLIRNSAESFFTPAQIHSIDDHCAHISAKEGLTELFTRDRDYSLHSAIPWSRQLLQTHKLVVFERHVHEGHRHRWTELLLLPQALRRRHQSGSGAQHSVIHSRCCLVTPTQHGPHCQTALRT